MPRFVIVVVVALLPDAGGWRSERPGSGRPPGPGARPILIRELAVQGNRRVQEAVILGRIRSVVGVPVQPLAGLRRRPIHLHARLLRRRPAQGRGLRGRREADLRGDGAAVRAGRGVHRATASSTPTTLQEKIDLKLGSVYNPVDVERAKEKIKDAYEDEGYFEVQVSSGRREVRRRRREGDLHGRTRAAGSPSRRSSFEGNKGLTDSQIKDVMITKERQLFILRGTVQRQKLEEDVERIVGLYQDHGYVQMRVERYDTSVNRETARVTITHRYRGGAAVPGRHDQAHRAQRCSPRPRSAASFASRPETSSRAPSCATASAGITDLYSTIGRASAEVIPRTDQQPATLTMDVTIEVTEGPEVYVERINISGNTRSEDRILRREIPFVEGDLFTLQKLQRARQRLINLGYFESVNVETAARDRQDADHRERGSHRAADRRLLHRRRLLVGGQLRRYPRHLPEQLPGPGLAGGPADPGRRHEPAGHHQLHRALAVRPAARRPASICSASSATTPTTTTSRSAATSG